MFDGVSGIIMLLILVATWVTMGLTIILGIYISWVFLHYKKEMKNKDAFNISGVKFALILVVVFIDTIFVKRRVVITLLLIGGIIEMAIYCVRMFLRKMSPNKIEKDNDVSDISDNTAIKIVVATVMIIIAILYVIRL